MSEYTQTKLSAIKTLLETVDGIENVYIRDKFTIDPAEFNRLFTKRINSQKYKVNTWLVGRESFSEGVEVRPRFVARMPIVVRGFLEFKDDPDSTAEFNDLIDKIRTAFRNNLTIWDVCETEVEAAVQGRVFGYRFLSEVFCHYCELVIELEEHNFKE